MANNNLIVLENARITFCNLAGRKRQFNDEGKRNFNVILTEEQAQKMIDEGLHVRTLPARDEYSEPRYLLKINANMDSQRPPKIFLCTAKKQTQLDADMLSEVDNAAADQSIVNVDLSFRPYRPPLRTDGNGASAYLNSMYVTIEEDELAERYSKKYEEADDDLPF